MALDLGLGTVIKIASDFMTDRASSNTGASDAYRKASQFSFSSDVYRGMKEPEGAKQVKASEAVSYEELNNMWDRILPNAYAEIIKTVEQPAFSPKKDIA